MEKQDYIDELDFCIKMWEEKGGCTFGGGNKCEDCAAPYLLLKFISGEVLHGDIKRLTFEEWKEKIEQIKNSK